MVQFMTVFGFLINVNMITFFEPMRGSCFVHFPGRSQILIQHTCDEVYAEIQRQLDATRD